MTNKQKIKELYETGGIESVLIWAEQQDDIEKIDGVINKQPWQERIEKKEKEILDIYIGDGSGGFPLGMDGVDGEVAIALREYKQIIAEEMEKQRDEIIDMVIPVLDSIDAADKTPKYEYSKHASDANRRGQLPESGSRWAMPRELAQGLKTKLQSLKTNK